MIETRDAWEVWLQSVPGLERPCSCLCAQQGRRSYKSGSRETWRDGPSAADPLPQDVQLLSFSPWDEASISTLSWYYRGQKVY